MDYKTYVDKVKGCFIGKTIGGTLGAPFECYHGLYNITFFQQDISNPVPNDDLDLQLVWLVALENEGKNLDSETLAKYWASHVFADFCEYGVGKNNYAAGILPPLSGYIRNENRDSNGAWIRTEIWACVCPGNPYLASYYAYQDSSVDHSSEGINASVFLAALESAAFFEKDVYKLIDIGLSFIPKDCAIAHVCEDVVKSYKSGKSFLATRKTLFTKYPTDFAVNGNWGYKGNKNGIINGVKINKEVPIYKNHPFPKGKHGWDAPCHIGIILMGWLYGKGDFAKSICLATNLGEDTDCTAGTLASILGIILGANKIPTKWKKACSEKIVTCTIVNQWNTYIPKDVNELTKRVAKVMPTINDCLTKIDNNGVITIEPCKDLKYNKTVLRALHLEHDNPLELIKDSPCTIRKKFCRLIARVTYDKNLVAIKEGGMKELTIDLTSSSFINHYVQVSILNAPKDWKFIGGKKKSLSLAITHGSIKEYNNRVKFNFKTMKLTKSRYHLVVEIALTGEGEKYYIPVMFYNGSI